VQASWNSHTTGSPFFRIVCKLKRLKLDLKAWSKTGIASPIANFKALSEKLALVQYQLTHALTDSRLHRGM